MFDFALEAMNAQVQSKFGSELDKLWQSVIDYRDKDLKDVTDYRTRYRKIKDFFHANIAKKFMDLTWKYTGLWIRTTKYVELWESGFCTWMFLGGNSEHDQSGTFQIENVLNGGFLERYWSLYLGNINALTPQQLLKIANSYDVLNGCIKPTQKEEIRKLIKSDIGFDIRTGFLMEDFLPKNSGVLNFTAREITAIVMHEIGHTLTLVEHAADTYARTASFNYLTEAFKALNGGDVGKAVELGRLTATELQKKGQTDAATKLSKVVDKFEADCFRAGKEANPHAKHNMILGLLNIIITIIMDAIVMPLDAIFGNNARFKFSASDQKKKFGDIPCNGRLVTWQERKADEYAFTNGYGADQVTALDKLGRLFCRLGKTPEQIEQIKNAERLNKDIGFFEKCGILIAAPLYTGNYGSMLYPEGSKRFREMMNLAINQLKTAGADPELIRKYMDDIEKIKDRIDHCEKHDEYVAKVVKGYELFNHYISIPGFFDCLVHGRIKKEIDNLIDDIQKLSGNLINYYGFKLKQLSKKDS